MGQHKEICPGENNTLLSPGEKQKVISEKRKMSTQSFCFINFQETFIKVSQPSVSLGPRSQIQPITDQNYLKKKKKDPESSRKQNLNLPFSSSYLHSIYIILIFTTICIYIVLGIIGKLEMV